MAEGPGHLEGARFLVLGVRWSHLGSLTWQSVHIHSVCSTGRIVAVAALAIP